MKTAMVAFEGVCVPDDPDKSLFEQQPVLGTLQLLTALSSQYNLIVYSRFSVTPSLVSEWLRTQSFPTMELILGQGVEGAVLRARRRGYDVELVLDSNPAHIAQCVKMGVFALLVVSPSYMRPEFRPDFEGEIRPWDQMVEKIDAVREQRNRDSRFEVVEP